MPASSVVRSSGRSRRAGRSASPAKSSRHRAVPDGQRRRHQPMDAFVVGVVLDVGSTALGVGGTAPPSATSTDAVDVEVDGVARDRSTSLDDLDVDRDRAPERAGVEVDVESRGGSARADTVAGQSVSGVGSVTRRPPQRGCGPSQARRRAYRPVASSGDDLDMLRRHHRRPGRPPPAEPARRAQHHDRRVLDRAARARRRASTRAGQARVDRDLLHRQALLAPAWTSRCSPATARCLGERRRQRGGPPPGQPLDGGAAPAGLASPRSSGPGCRCWPPIQGGCIGGAVDMVCAADMRYATADAFFCIQEINIGMTADVGTLQRLPEAHPRGRRPRAGPTPATASRPPGPHEVGLVNQVFDDHESLVEPACSRSPARIATPLAARHLGHQGDDQLHPRPLGGRQPPLHGRLAVGHVPAAAT